MGSCFQRDLHTWNVLVYYGGYIFNKNNSKC